MTATTSAVALARSEDPVYPSLAALRVAHRKLLHGFERNNPSPEALDGVGAFLVAGRQTGAVLPDEEQRSAAQSVLDYWSAVLYRAKRQPPDATLVPFSPPARFAAVACPYPGLAAFDAKERDFFLGRETVVDDLVAKLTSTRLLVVTGPRGCGKSSLVRAGLLPALQAGALPGSDRWTYLGPVIPGPQPLDSLRRALPQPPNGAALRTDPASLANAVRTLGPALLFVDQLEDVLPAPGEALDGDGAAFVASLVQLVNAADVACILVATRTDDPVDPAFHVADDLLAETARVDVPEFGTRELRDAIQRPAELVGVTFDDEVVPDLVRALVGVPVAPPLLQWVLAALWESRRGRVITWDAYRALMWDPRRRRANASWAIGRAAQERYDKLASAPAAQAAMKSILLQLVVPGEGSDVALRRLRISDLRRGRVGGTEAPPEPEAFDRALHELMDGRLLRCSTSSEGDANDPSVEVVHSALTRNWQTLDRWLVEVRIEQERRRRLQAATKEWLDHARSEDALWREALLEGLDEHDPQLGRAEQEFIAESRLAVGRMERRRVRGQQLKSLAAVGVVITLAVVVVAFLVWREALSARSHQLLASTSLVDDPAAALLLAVSAYQINPDDDARVGVLDELERHRQLVGILPTGGQLSASTASSDGSLLAAAETVSSGGSHAEVVLWDGGSLAELRRLDMRKLGSGVNSRSVRALAFDGSGARLAVAFDDNTVSVWNPQTGMPTSWRPDPNQPEQMLLSGHTLPLSALAFDSRAGHDQLVSIGLDGLVSWELQTGTIALRAPIGSRPIVALSPDGAHVAAFGCGANEAGPECSSPRTLRLWDTATAGLEWSGLTPGSPVGLWFSQQSDALAVANQNGTVEVRDARAPDSVLAPPIATGPAVRVALDSSSGLLVTATCKLVVGRECSPDDDAHVQTFDIRQSAAVGPPLVVPPGGVPGLQLLPSVSVSPSDAGQALRIALPGPSEVTVLDMLNDRVGQDPGAVADSLGGLGPGVVRVGPERVAVLGCISAEQGTRCPAGTLHLADARSGASIGRNLVGEPPATVSALAASLDGGGLAAGHTDGGIDIWDLSNSVRRLRLPPADSSGPISSLAFAADGRLAAASAPGESAPGRLRVWSLDNPQTPLGVDLPTTNPIASVLAFSPDATTLGSGRLDGNLETWQVSAGASHTVRIYGGHAGAISSIAFSPDKRLIAAAGSKQKVLVWDASSTRLVGEPLLASNLDGPVATLAFSLDSETLTASDGNNVAVWRLQLSAATDPVRRACQIAHRNLRPDEWKILQVERPFWALGCPQWPS